jgi:hypothetical protein
MKHGCSRSFVSRLHPQRVLEPRTPILEIPAILLLCFKSSRTMKKKQKDGGDNVGKKKSGTKRTEVFVEMLRGTPYVMFSSCCHL